MRTVSTLIVIGIFTGLIVVFDAALDARRSLVGKLESTVLVCAIGISLGLMIEGIIEWISQRVAAWRAGRKP